jgi:hypothetical protein
MQPLPDLLHPGFGQPGEYPLSKIGTIFLSSYFPPEKIIKSRFEAIVTDSEFISGPPFDEAAPEYFSTLRVNVPVSYL